MKRVIALATLAASVILVLVVNANAGPGDHHAGRTIAVVEHADNDAVTNGTAGDDVGNILTFANPVFNSADTQQVGTDQGSCIRLVVGESWECNWTTFLQGGSITVEGPFFDAGDSSLAITGGTGIYRNARGYMRLSARAGGTEFDFNFPTIG